MWGGEKQWQISSLPQMACSAPVAAFSGGQPSRRALSGWRNINMSIWNSWLGRHAQACPGVWAWKGLGGGV